MVIDEIRDVYSILKKYQNARKKLSIDKSINQINRKLFVEFLNKKEDELRRRKGRERIDKIRYSKTLYKYICLLRLTNRIFGDSRLDKITEDDIKKVYDDLEEGRVKTARGTKLSKATREDLYHKIFKSDFFEGIGKKEMARKVVTLESSKDEEVRYFEKEDLDLMANLANKAESKLFFYLLFDTGMRIGTLLNCRSKDFEKRHNVKTKQDYYIVHIRKEYTKSKANRTISLLLNETNELLDVVLKGMKKEEVLFNLTYSGARKIIKRIAKKAKVKTKPDGKEVAVHDFRRSCATYLLGKGYSVDFVKKRLGHRPSSDTIDKYINYLGLNEEEFVTQAQDMDYNQLRINYKEAIERIKVLDQNQKQYSEELNELKRLQEEREKRLQVLDKAAKEQIVLSKENLRKTILDMMEKGELKL